MNRFWIAVASRDHVAIGAQKGFAQVCHGKCNPLKRMKAGDWLVYYSPRAEMNAGAVCRSFTAIGQVTSGVVYQVEQTPDFKPYRIDVKYHPCTEAPIHPMLEQLSFTQGNKNWGMLFRRGHFEVSSSDFISIATAMKAGLCTVQLDFST